MTTPTTWHYSKLADGTWGAQAFGRLGRKSTWKAGQAVTVTARDGQAQTRTVASLELWQPYASGTKCVLRLEVDAEIAAAAARKEDERTQARQAERRARDQQRQAAREADAQRKAHRVHVVAGRVQIGDLLMSGGWPQHPMRVTSLGQPFTKQLTTWQYAYGERAPEGEAADLAALERHTWQLRQPADGVRTVPCRAGALVVGQTFRWRDDVLTVAELGRRWFQEALMSLGRAYGEGTEARHNNEGWRQDAVCRPATADSAGALEAQEAAILEAAQQQRARRDLFAAVVAAAAVTDGLPAHADTERFWQNRHLSLYGGGEYLLVTADEQLWHVQRNTADGDNWAHNNCEGGIARRVPATHPQHTAWCAAVGGLGPQEV